jgi:hypothetical protein
VSKDIGFKSQKVPLKELKEKPKCNLQTIGYQTIKILQSFMYTID